MLRVRSDAELRMLEMIILSDGLTLKLHTNLEEVTDRGTASSFVEPVHPGYAPIPLNAADWVLSSGDSPREPALAVHPAVRWRFQDAPEGAPETIIRGYFVTWSDGRLAWEERFVRRDGSPREQAVEFDGDSITVIPKFSLRDLTEG